jgi:hypothetical protein
MLDSISGFLALAVTVFASYSLVKRLFRGEDIFTVLIITFILGLTVILIPLYIIGIYLGAGIVATSWIIFIVSLAITLMSAIKFIPKVPENVRKLRGVLMNLGPLDIAFAAAIVFLVVRYFYILSIKGIFDWDAIGQYLPFGRRIYETDRIPISAYDFEPVVGPSGISVLYGWIFSLGGSPYDESFRLFPIIFLLVTILIVYALGRDFGSKRKAQIGVIVFAFLPMHDAILFFASYYPDLCYGALILAVFFLLQRGITKQQHKYAYYLLGGVAFGLSILMKLQAVYFVPAILFVLIIFLKNRRLRLVLSYLSVLLLFFIFVSFVWPDTKFFFSLPIVSQVLGLLFIFGATTCAFVAMEGYIKASQIKQVSFIRILASAAAFFGTAIPIAALWFLRNVLLTGSLVWNFKMDIPNRPWALGFLSSVQSSTPSNTILTFLLSLILIPFTVYVLGTMWLVPKLAGLFQQIRAKKKTLLLILWTVGYWLGYFLSVFHHFEVYVVNPRDFFVFAPFFSLFAAFGLTYIVEHFTKKHIDSLTLYLLCSFGLFSLTQSMLMSNYSSVAFGRLVTVFQLPEFTITSLSLLPGLLLIVAGVTVAIIAVLIVLRASAKNWPRKILPIVLMFSLLVAPYLWITYEFGNGNVYAFGENQLKPLFGGLFTEVAPYLEEHGNNGDVVLMVESYPLQYYLHKNITVLALSVPSDLAAFRSVIESDNLSVVFNSLREIGVRYFLCSKGSSPLTVKLSTASLLLDIIQDPRYVVLDRSFSSWTLYELMGTGKLSIVQGWMDDSFSNWNYTEAYSTVGAYYDFSSDGTVATINVAGNSRANFKYGEMPRINITEYPYIAYRVKGSSNARWLLRLYAENGQICYDFPYWQTPTTYWSTFILNMAETPLRGKLLDPGADLAVKSADNDSATLFIDYYMIFKYEPYAQ